MKPMHRLTLGLLLFAGLCIAELPAQVVPPAVSEKRASSEAKLSSLKQELMKKWPTNRTVRFVFHGHSVPAGYFRAGRVRRFDSYPIIFHKTICEKYPNAVIDVSVTAIGGEQSGRGAKRFETDVLAKKPDVVLIDYSLNDRRIGLKRAEVAWRSMIERCLERDLLVVLLTPTPDSHEDVLNDNTPLATHAKQVRELGESYGLPIIDSYAEFGELVANGNKIGQYLSQPNHPNRAGHEIVADLLVKLFRPQQAE